MLGLSPRATWIAGLVAVYAVIRASFEVFPSIQRFAIYAHRIRSPYFWLDPSDPIQSGFAPNQVTPFRVPINNDEFLYAWQITPLDLYAQPGFQQSLGLSPSEASDITIEPSFNALLKDPDTRLVISFHGNAGTVAQGYRPELYRLLGTSKTFVWAIDYRGFGKSSGSSIPTEQSLIEDGIATVNLAIKNGIPPSKIVLMGHSLGTGVAAAVLAHFSSSQTVFAGTVLVSGFSDMQSLLTISPTYSIGGFLSAGILLWPTAKIVDTWPSAERLAHAVRMNKQTRIHILHSKNDWEIPWHHADQLFLAAANATTEAGMDAELVQKMKARSTVETGNGGFTSVWKSAETTVVEEIVNWGGHNGILVGSSVMNAVLLCFLEAQ